MSNPMTTGYQYNASGDPSDDRYERRLRGKILSEHRIKQELLDGTVRELMSWFMEDSQQLVQIDELVDRAVQFRSQLEMEFERN